MNGRTNEVRAQTQVDDLCRQFARHLADGGAPAIAGFVNRAPEAYRDDVRRRLVTLVTLLVPGADTGMALDETIMPVTAETTPEDTPQVPRAPTHDGDVSSLDATIDVAHSLTDIEETLPPGGIPKQAEQAHPKISGYRIQSVLGRGGMGVVYKAVQISLGRAVALKMVLDRAAASQDALDRFEREAQAVAELNDPHFVQIFDFGTHDDKPFMALELVEGGSLEEYRRGEPLPERYAAETVETLARAMHTAHQAGLVHRDLKPQNILLAADGSPKITDFGLVKRLEQDDSQMTEQGCVMGTASYMAPEQSRGEPNIGPAADVHALGGILYCLLTGRPPFLGANIYDTIQQVRTEEPVPPSRLQPGVSKDLETICLKCLQKDPSKRYASALELADDLERHRDGRPITARPVGRLERIWRWARRNPLGATVAGLVVAIAFIASAMSWRLALMNQRLETETHNAQIARDHEQEQRQAAETAQEAKSRQYNEVLLAYHTVLDRVDRQLRNDPSQVQLRKGIVQLALDSLKNVRDDSETSRLADRDEAVGKQRLGDIYQVVGDLPAALEQYDLAYRITKNILQRAPDDPEQIRNVAAVCNKQGQTLERLGQRPEARKRYEEALQLRRKWEAIRTRQNHPNHLDAKRAIARECIYLGSIDLALGDPARALDDFNEARAWYRKLPKDILLRPAVYRELTALEHWLGETYTQLGDVDEAERMLTRVVKKRSVLANSSQDDSAVRELCRSQLKLGDFYLILKDDMVKAGEHYRPAWVEYNELWKANPTSRDLRRDVANIEYRIGGLLVAAKKAAVTLRDVPGGDDPHTHFERSCTFREALANIDPEDMQAKIEWAVALARCGRAAEAEKQAEILVKKGSHDPRLLFQAACTLALCSVADDRQLADRCRDRAFGVLDRLIESGWKDTVALAKDPDLDPLRGDPRYAKRIPEQTETTHDANHHE